MELELPVLWYTEEQQKLISSDIEVDFKDCITKQHTFYTISHIRPYNEKCCSVCSDAQYFIVPLKYEKVKEMISKSMLFKFI
ncbi:hypothetical protein [Flavobacterium mekongense]|uniref:hypothetical protein n=1 Tax=Flavobacterium mekongense TaxID=3379707 RepID=UPI00399A4A63